MNIIPTNLSFLKPPIQRQSTSLIVIHHTADHNDPTVGPNDKTVKDVHYSHITRGWIGIGYNLLQTDDGKWYEGRGIDKEGAHATGYNRNAIGICLTGNFEDNKLPEYRKESLIEMCVFLCRRYFLDYTNAVGHKELPGAATLCPGININLSELRMDVRRSLTSPTIILPTLYKVKEDNTQIGVYRNPITAVTQAIEKKIKLITLERV